MANDMQQAFDEEYEAPKAMDIMTSEVRHVARGRCLALIGFFQGEKLHVFISI
jgi:hypothetical protein